MIAVLATQCALIIASLAIMATGEPMLGAVFSSTAAGMGIGVFLTRIDRP